MEQSERSYAHFTAYEKESSNAMYSACYHAHNTQDRRHTQTGCEKQPRLYFYVESVFINYSTVLWLCCCFYFLNYARYLHHSNRILLFILSSDGKIRLSSIVEKAS